MNITKDNDLLKEQTRLTKAKADTAELKRDVLKGSLVKIKDVQKQWKEAASNVRTKLLALPEIAPQIAGLGVQEVRNILTQKVREILNELAEQYR